MTQADVTQIATGLADIADQLRTMQTQLTNLAAGQAELHRAQLRIAQWLDEVSRTEPPEQTRGLFRRKAGA